MLENKYLQKQSKKYELKISIKTTQFIIKNSAIYYP